MLTTSWRTSPREHDVYYERTGIVMPDRVTLAAEIWRPEAEGEYPAILGYHPYEPAPQTAPITPTAIGTVAHLQPGHERSNGFIEAGDPNFFAMRGYVYVLVSIRGTGDSEGTYKYLSQQEFDDGYQTIEWIADQSWCDGNIGMFGVSYFARIQYFVAATKPPHLKCLFAPWASTDQYRDVFYHGGILNKDWPLYWGRSSLRNTRYESEPLESMSGEELSDALASLRDDPDIALDQGLGEVLADPTKPSHRLVVDVLLNYTDTDFWIRRRPAFDEIKVPVYMGADWANYGLHLAGAFRNWTALAHVPRRMTVGPTPYLDRPLYQMQYESLRWYDRWLKGIDVGLEDEPPIQLYLRDTGQWESGHDWPLPQTRFTPFYLHEQGRLWEREHFPNEGYSSFSDSPWGREYLEFTTARLVEETEIIGPLALQLYASSSSDEILFFVSIREVDVHGGEKILTRGWLRGTHRELDEQRSEPWLPYHTHQERKPIVPNQIERFDIPIVPTANRFPPGSRLKLKVSTADDPSTNSMEAIAGGHIRRSTPSRITVHHSREFPSQLLVPVTRGNLLGTYLSGGANYVNYG